ncbi:MAG: hypothetical protein WCV41_00410 [Patescibacteria group bacterium]
MKKSVIISVVTVIILALIGGGVFWYLKQGKQAVDTLVTENEPEQNANSTTEDVDTSDWLTYKNEEYGFEARYPKNFQVQKLLGEYYKDQEYPYIGTNITNPNTDLGTYKEMNVYIYDQGVVFIGNDLSDSIAFEFAPIKSFEELQKSNDFFQGNFETVNGTKFLKIIDKKTHGGEAIYYIAQNKYNSKFIPFSTYLGGIDNTVDNQKKQLIHNIISTVKFTK